MRYTSLAVLLGLCALAHGGALVRRNAVAASGSSGGSGSGDTPASGVQKVQDEAQSKTKELYDAVQPATENLGKDVVNAFIKAIKSVCTKLQSRKRRGNSGTIVDSHEDKIAYRARRTFNLNIELPSVDNGGTGQDTAQQPTAEPTVQEPAGADAVDEPNVDATNPEEPTVGEPTMEEPNLDSQTPEEPQMEDQQADSLSPEEPQIDLPNMEDPQGESSSMEMPDMGDMGAPEEQGMSEQDVMSGMPEPGEPPFTGASSVGEKLVQGFCKLFEHQQE